MIQTMVLGLWMTPRHSNLDLNTVSDSQACVPRHHYGFVWTVEWSLVKIFRHQSGMFPNFLPPSRFRAPYEAILAPKACGARSLRLP